MSLGGGGGGRQKSATETAGDHLMMLRDQNWRFLLLLKCCIAHDRTESRMHLREFAIFCAWMYSRVLKVTLLE